MAHSSLCGHRKLGRLVRALQISEAEAVGTLEFLWWAADTEHVGPAGLLEGWTVEDIAYRCRWRGDPVELLEGLVSAGFIDRNGTGVLSIHDWAEWVPNYIRRRWKRYDWNAAGQPANDDSATTGQPVVDQRSTTGIPAPPLANPTQCKASQPNTPPTPPRGKRDFWQEAAQAMQGDCLNTVDFRDAWLEWIEGRKDRKHTCTNRTICKQIKELEAAGHDEAIAVLRLSDAKGYQGLVFRSRAGSVPLNGKPTIQPGQPSRKERAERDAKLRREHEAAWKWWESLDETERLAKVSRWPPGMQTSTGHIILAEFDRANRPGFKP